MRRIGALAATVLALLLHTVTPAHRVSASHETEAAQTIAFVRAHAPLEVEAQARDLAGDVNRERVLRGIVPLIRNAALDGFAAEKALDMASRGYFGHTSPDGVTFEQRVHAAGWPNAYRAENIAFDIDEPSAHRAFMNSPPHFANVVDRNERRIGVAVVTVGTGETFYVEAFSS
jgi:uncharacterized protein YkwD